jgi:hypothetical protein
MTLIKGNTNNSKIRDKTNVNYIRERTLFQIMIVKLDPSGQINSDPTSRQIHSTRRDYDNTDHEYGIGIFMKTMDLVLFFSLNDHSSFLSTTKKFYN